MAKDDTCVKLLSVILATDNINLKRALVFVVTDIMDVKFQSFVIVVTDNTDVKFNVHLIGYCGYK